MGQEITSTEYSNADYDLFKKKLRNETKIVKNWFENKTFTDNQLRVGLELEAWLVDRDKVPAPSSCEFLKKLNSPIVVPEISKFNFELNSHPEEIGSSTFYNLEHDMVELWDKCQNAADELELQPLLIGTLPTLRDHMLTMENLSPQKRYFVLNERVMEMREGRPTTLDFEGLDHIHIEHNDIITECAATSLQIHYGVTNDNAKSVYNASIVASPFMAAVGANSPFFFGKELWDESRIPIFEQSVNLRSFRKIEGGFARRVGLGNGYVKNSLLELFIENLDGYPIIIPELGNSDSSWLDHFRLHNGTIWRWTRPIVGFNSDGKATMRIEHRTVPAGPTLIDQTINMAFFFGLITEMAKTDDWIFRIPHDVAMDNFYKSAKKGMDTRITWIDNKKINLRKLCLKELIPKARKGLKALNINDDEAEFYLKLLKERLESKQTGSFWQKAWVKKYGKDWNSLTMQYSENQQTHQPVHTWKI